ncbi:MAG: glycine cleavage system protein T [Alphaproteobacteria bacterium]|nr:glycine cleavage system protein T [Alphaproteobacteria bacterium]
MHSFTPTARIRKSPFYRATLAEGVTSFTPYNRMLMPTGYGDPEKEYWRLIEAVSLWDVAIERQVELKGRDAADLVQILCPRDLSNCAIGQGKYIALCNHAGTIINDPILLKLSDQQYWLSIADSDVLLWARAIAAERGLDVQISEPDVSPLAVQGPKSDDVVASVFGDWVRDLKYFWFQPSEVDGIPVAVARSGWSKQGGFEIYLMDGTRGTDLWNIIREAGQPHGIGPGNPNACERVESGLLSFGGDTDDETNPFEIRMEKYVDLDAPDEVVGIQALRSIVSKGIKRHQLGVILDGDVPHQPDSDWMSIWQDGTRSGHMTNCIWSYRLKANIGFALISVDAKPGDTVTVDMAGTSVSGRLTRLPFV